MVLTIIAAVSENNVIGNKGKLPWRIPEDLKRFKELTLEHSVIMGLNTYLSLPKKFRPLPDRKNIVLSDRDYDEKGIYVARSIDEALRLCDCEESFVIGGASVYEQFLPLSQRMELTRVHGEIEGDVFFPEVNWSEWKETETKLREGYSFHSYVRT